MHKRPWLAIALLVGLGLFLIPMTSSAFIYHYGEAPVVTGDIPSDILSNGESDPGKKAILEELEKGFISDMEGRGFQAGYYCKTIFAVMWAYVMLSDCEPALVTGTTGDTFEVYGDEQFDEEWPGIRASIQGEFGIDLGEKNLSSMLEDSYSEDDMQLNAWEAHGKWVLALLLLLIIGAKFMGGDDEEEVPDMSALDTDDGNDDAGGGDDGGAFSFNDGDAPADDGGGDDSPLG